MNFITYQPLFWLFLLIPLMIVFYYSLVERRKLFKILSFIFRVLGIILIIIALCRPFFTVLKHSAHVIFLVDVSESVDLKSVEKKIDTVSDKIKEMPAGNSWSLYSFAARTEESTPEKLKKKIKKWETGLADDNLRRKTDIGDALLHARMAFPGGKGKRIILISDGRDTGGNLSQALAILRKENVDVQFMTLSGITSPEASVLSLKSNPSIAYLGEKCRMSVTLYSNTEMKGSLRLINRGVVEVELPVNLKKGTSKVECDIVMNSPGSTVWTAELIPEHDYYPINNKASQTVEVRGKAKVLALHRNPSEMRLFAHAMKKQDIDVDVRTPKGMPDTMNRLMEFDAVILADIPATEMTTAQMMLLKEYVTEFGGGLIMLGSENSFGLGGYYKTPVEEVLPIVSRYEKEKEKPSLAMCLVIDKSGSMDGDKIAIAREGAKAAVELLSPRDSISVVAFDSESRVICDMTSAVNQQDIFNAIDSLAAGGGTNMYPAMIDAMNLLEAVPAKIKHMIILGDGQSQEADFEGLTAQIANSNITVSTVALGEGADRYLMAAIAEIGNGRYYETMDPDNVPRIFTKETMEASRSAIKEDPFVPIRVGSGDFLEGVDFDNAPYLLGYVMTKMKPTAKIQLITESGDPLLASARFGLGKSVAFTSNVSDTWAGEWLRWKDFGPLWAQIIRSCVRKDDYSGIIVHKQKLPDKIRYNIIYRDQAGMPVTGVHWKTIYQRSDGKKVSPEIKEIGYGLYRITVPDADSGCFSLHIIDTDNDKRKVVHSAKNYPDEYRLGTDADPLLLDLPVFSDSNDPIADIAPVKAKEPFFNLFIILAVIAFILSVFFRRI